jgi:hypothetical protein
MNFATITEAGDFHSPPLMSEPPPLPAVLCPCLPRQSLTDADAKFRHRCKQGFCPAHRFHALDWLFGLVALTALLAACSVIPVLNFLSLGYLLHVSGTIARTGRIRDGFIGMRKASVLGSIAAGTWLVVWPARLSPASGKMLKSSRRAVPFPHFGMSASSSSPRSRCCTSPGPASEAAN